MIIVHIHCTFCGTAVTAPPTNLADALDLPLLTPGALPSGWRLYIAQCADRVLPPTHDNMAEALHEAYGSVLNAGAMAPMVAHMEQYKVPLRVALIACAECVRARTLEDIEQKLDAVREEREGRQDASRRLPTLAVLAQESEDPFDDDIPY